ncbi:MAG: hypothetical protein WC531_03080 [Candidatus Paceibacterota bacterium]|jgi:hypothetical protein
MAEKTVTKSLKIAYTINQNDVILNVRHSANGWWMDRGKMYRLIAAFQIDATLEEACSHAGITLREYKYFASLQPEIRDLRKRCEASLILKARKNIFDAISSGDWKCSWKYLEKKCPDEFGRGPSLQKKLPPSNKMTFFELTKEGELKELKDMNQN